MKAYELADEYKAPETEREVLAAVARDVDLYWELAGYLGRETFTEHGDTFEALRKAIEAEEARPDLPADWTPADDPQAAAERLRELWQRRELADAGQTFVRLLKDPETPAPEIAAAMEEAGARLGQLLQADAAGELAWPEDLLPGVLEQAREAREHYQETGDCITGVKTGLKKLDMILGGLPPGLVLMAGGPGTGKTTLALQLAVAAAEEVPVVYVTFENSPENLTLRGLCAAADPKLNPRNVSRGFVEPGQLEAAAGRWKEKARRLAFIEGRADLTRAAVRGKARRAMNRFGTDRCLIIVDYLQLWAKAARELRDLGTVRERVELMGGQLRELAMQLRSPVLAIASQHRGAGYGSGRGSSSLDSLKESGDLEYSADVALFLTESEERMATAPARALDLTVSKNRYGETGGVELIFRPDQGTMRPVGGEAVVGANGTSNGSPF